MYEVVYAARKGRKFENLTEALLYAREAKEHYAHPALTVTVWDVQGGVILAVATDDANGLHVHRLNPTDNAPPEINAAWEEYHRRR